jgi:hypothetical protein
VAGALAAVDVQDVPGDERAEFEERHGVNDVADLAHAADWMEPRESLPHDAVCRHAHAPIMARSFALLPLNESKRYPRVLGLGAARRRRRRAGTSGHECARMSSHYASSKNG